MMSGLAAEILVEQQDEEIHKFLVISDIWEDEAVLHKLQQGIFPLGLSTMERDIVSHRIIRFRWANSLLVCMWPNGTRRIVPRPDQRVFLVRQVHEELGHFGVQRTHSMLRNKYWWTGMYQQVATYISRCEVCDRVKLSFNILSPKLQPLPIMGLGYCWYLNFAEPLTITPRGA